MAKNNEAHGALYVCTVLDKQLFPLKGAQHCEQIAVLEHGRLVEAAQVAAFMRAPASAAGQALLRAAQVLQAGG